MAGDRIRTFFSIISVCLLVGCGAFSNLGTANFAQGPEGSDDSTEVQGPTELSSPNSPHSPPRADALPNTINTGPGIAAAPELAASSPATVVCPIPEVLAKVQRSDHGQIRTGDLCLTVKRLTESGAYENLPNDSWGFTAEYRDPEDGEFRDAPRCGRSGNALGLGGLASTPKASSSGETIDVVVRVLRVIHFQGQAPTCEDLAPLENGFSLQVTYAPNKAKAWQGEQVFTLPQGGITFDPFLLNPVE